MLPRANTRALIGVFLFLAILSLTVKGLMGPTIAAPPKDGPASVEAQVVAIMQEQGFATSVRHLKVQSAIVYAVRGRCSLSARDASGAGAGEAVSFADDARNIGPVRYFYNGGIYGSPPSLRTHLAVIRSTFLRSLGFRPALHVPLAIAATEACGNSTFRIGDIQLTT